MLVAGDKLVAGISGGADSVCLLFLLYGLRAELNLDITVVHVNHGIRAEAGRDEEYVKSLCEKWDIPFIVVREDVPVLSKEWGMSEEEAGRKVRYEAFCDAARKCGARKIAVAHNKNDNAETVLFHLFRGSGIHGLTGIPAKRELNPEPLEIIRPLLCLDRHEIESILLDEEINWVCDVTNESDEYSRNRIRLNIMPEAEKVACGAADHILQASYKLSEIEDLLIELENKCLKECVRSGNRLNVSAFNPNHVAVKKRVIHSLLATAAGGKKDIGAKQIDQVLEMCEIPGNRSVDLAMGVTATREYDTIVIFKKGDEQKVASPSEDILLFSPKIFLETQKLKVQEMPGGIEKLLQEVSSKEGETVYTKSLDYDKINGQIELRTRRSGDWISVALPQGGFSQKSLKEYMINAKIPASVRDSIPVVAVGDKCLWLVGYRISDDCKITDNTSEVIRLHIEERE